MRFVYHGDSWFHRGHSRDNGVGAGTFGFGRVFGFESYLGSFRVGLSIIEVNFLVEVGLMKLVLVRLFFLLIKLMVV